MSDKKQVQVQYFAVFREKRGCSQETIETTAATARDLYEELRTRYDFHLMPQHLKVVINEEFQPWETPIQSHDVIVFIPPVAGG